MIQLQYSLSLDTVIIFSIYTNSVKIQYFKVIQLQYSSYDILYTISIGITISCNYDILYTISIGITISCNSGILQ